MLSVITDWEIFPKMAVEKKKLAIISAAVSAYMAAERVSEEKPVAFPLPAVSAWRSSGIQEMMEMRRFVQLRFLKSSR